MRRMQKPIRNTTEEWKNFQVDRKVLDRVDDEARKGNAEELKTLTRASKNEISRVKAIIKKKLPNLQQTHVRRYKLAYHESVILELQEENLTYAADFIKNLIQLEKLMEEKLEDVPMNQKRSLLRDKRDLIDLLTDSLVIVDQARKEGALITEAAALLQLALSFENLGNEMWWITEEIYKNALYVGRKIKNDEEQTITIMLYFYGRFLRNEGNRLAEASIYLNEAWMKSKEKNWNVSRILGIRQNSVFTESCVLLYEINLALAKQLEKNDLKEATKLCIKALEKAKDSLHEKCIANALYQLGKCELLSGNVENALKCFPKYLALERRLENYEGVCNAHIQLALSYREIKDEENTLRHLKLLLDLASEYQLFNKLADGHYYTGEYLLYKGKPELATPHLESSVSLYASLNRIDKCDRARCLAGVSKGQEIMEKYVNLILDCEKSSNAIVKMCKWKNSREPFWLAREFSKPEDLTDSVRNMDGEYSMNAFPSSISLSAESAVEVKTPEKENFN